MVETESVGTRYPFINLEKALGRARELYDEDPRGRGMLIGAAFNVWKYSDKSSGGFQTVAALRMYGLIDRTEKGKIALSEDALRYFKDERDEVKAKLLASFALQPDLIRALWKDWKDSPPGDAIARSHLKTDRNLTEQSARSLLAIYKENLAFANLKGDAMLPPEQEEDDDEDDVPPQIKIAVGDYVQWTSDGADQFKVPRRVIGLLDEEHAQVFGSNTGIPVSELTVVPPPSPGVIPPAPPRVDAGGNAGAMGENEYNVLQRGNRLQITADVDLDGLATLKEILGDYESILRRMSGQKKG